MTRPRTSGKQQLLPRQKNDVVNLDSMVVTGSRIARPELESAMPINVIDMEQEKISDASRCTTR